MAIEKWKFLVPSTNAWLNCEESQLEQVEDLESWIIIYLKLMSIKLM